MEEAPCAITCFCSWRCVVLLLLFDLCLSFGFCCFAFAPLCCCSGRWLAEEIEEGDPDALRLLFWRKRSAVFSLANGELLLEVPPPPVVTVANVAALALPIVLVLVPVPAVLFPFSPP